MLCVDWYIGLCARCSVAAGDDAHHLRSARHVLCVGRTVSNPMYHRLKDFSIHEICCDVSRAFRPPNIYFIYIYSVRRRTQEYNISTVSFLRVASSSLAHFFHIFQSVRIEEDNTHETRSYASKFLIHILASNFQCRGWVANIMHKMKDEGRKNTKNLICSKWRRASSFCVAVGNEFLFRFQLNPVAASRFF